MGIVDTLEKKFGRYVPDHLTNILVIGQGLSFVLVYSRPEFASLFYVNGRELFRGEIWRLLAMLFAPMSGGLLFTLLALYFFYIFGNQLESRWGSFRYLLYIAIGYIGMIVFSLLFPDILVTNFYMYTSLFLAFAYLYPNFQVLLFFIIPVKLKWLGYFAWFSLGLSMLSEPLPLKLLILFSVSNFFFFFFTDLRYSFRSLLHGRLSGVEKKVYKQKPNYICAVCGKNEVDNPDMEIRYCSQCIPKVFYCGEHIFTHQHKRLVD